jgi:hypothetical protein
MAGILHGSARTTPCVRAEFQALERGAEQGVENEGLDRGLDARAVMDGAAPKTSTGTAPRDKPLVARSWPIRISPSPARQNVTLTPP